MEIYMGTEIHYIILNEKAYEGILYSWRGPIFIQSFNYGRRKGGTAR